MFNIDGYDIEVTRGDTAALLFHFNGREIPSGTDAVFTIKKRPKDEECIVQKRVDASDGTATIYLTSDDTNYAARTYFWDIRLQIPLEGGGYETQTPMEYAAFTILQVIGGDIGSGDSEAMNPNLPVLVEVLDRAEALLEQLETIGGGGFSFTDEELLETLVETDTLTAVESDGGILTDENNNILLM